MNDLRKKIRKFPILQFTSSIKITVVCLVLLFVLTFWGTIAQINQGLYSSQERFFFSWYFLVFGFLPFPGARLVIWVLFLNLLSVSITRFVYKWSHIGICIIHIGLLTYFLSAFVSFHVIEESYVTLLENEGTNQSQSYREWEVAVWKDSQGDTKDIIAYDAAGIKSGTRLAFEELGISLIVDTYYSNSKAYTAKSGDDSESYINQSGIVFLTRTANDREPEKNVPGIIFAIESENAKSLKVLLYGGEAESNRFEINGEILHFSLRKKRITLPFVILLKEFEMEKHPGTEIAKAYRSLVETRHEGVNREVLIYMNHPLRHRAHTLYQASYSIDTFGRMRSTLAVVKNSGRLFPYISSIVTFLGLAIHFLLMAFPKHRKRSRKKK